MVSESTQLKRYRALSSAGEALSLMVEKMHPEGMSWGEIAKQLRVSNSALHICRHKRLIVLDWILKSEVPVIPG
jgi:hypothetical protein